MDADVVASCASGSKKARLKCLGRIVEVIPDAALTVAICAHGMGEVILGTKETSEKARIVSYECLVGMGRKMLEAGQNTHDETLWDDMREEDLSEEADAVAPQDDALEMDSSNSPREASFKEYLMMVLAGLTGGSAHMQSASISSLSRLLFEFKGSTVVHVYRPDVGRCID